MKVLGIGRLIMLRKLATTPQFIYVAPALLCSLTMLCGFIPSLFCLDGAIFAKISVAIFIASLVIHFYILMRWKDYSNSGPMAYALVQPSLHLILMALSLAVGATNMCAPSPNTNADNELIEYDLRFKKGSN